MNVYETHDLTALLAANSYPGRGIVPVSYTHLTLPTKLEV